METDGGVCCGDGVVMGTDLKLVAGMGMRVAGTVRNGYKNLSSCSSLVNDQVY